MTMGDFKFEKKDNICPFCGKEMREDGIWYICNDGHGRLSRFCNDLRASLLQNHA